MLADVVCVSKITEKSSFLCKSSLLQQQGNFQLRHTGWRIEHSAVMRKQDKKKGKRHAAQDQLFVSFIFMN